ncbi:hypothetical protein B6D12_01670 [Gilliamella apicola]|nr:hypothetical protein B5S41_13165 [Gilliamella apicola]OTP92209.1 hypothetical protein B6D13_13145 [Gilliamella apicola]OTP92408.1 hypothetical protein B6D05_12225 [Gilliamella apicola]OTP98905.1 hypothetical protein B6D07_12580 [Gilliamella apicola]OTQ06843.1 hypothetical protein B6D12_01670 [Gilliamella apicola]
MTFLDGLGEKDNISHLTNCAMQLRVQITIKN